MHLHNLDMLSPEDKQPEPIEKTSENKLQLVTPKYNLNKLIHVVGSHTLLDPIRLKSLWRLVSDINRRGVQGDIVECGCYKGGSSVLLKAGMGPGRRLWLYDSFQGLPAPSKEDGEYAVDHAGSLRAAVDDVIEIMTNTGAGTDRLVIKEGWFQDTFKQSLPDRVALLHCDADWYESVLLVLDTFYSRMPDGACIILDDFGHWKGCRLAFYEFCEKHGERPLIERVGYSQAYWIKGRETNTGH